MGNVSILSTDRLQIIILLFKRIILVRSLPKLLKTTFKRQVVQKTYMMV